MRETYLWPLTALVLVIVPQVLVPSWMREGPPVAVPAVEALVVLILANTTAAARLVTLVLRSTPEGSKPPTVTQLLITAVTLLATNIVTFGLLYWQLDGGGPDARQNSVHYPDFAFPQTAGEGLAPPGWKPRFPDHIYVAFTNVVAFSPTDTLPLTHRAKALMAVQSLISLGVLAVVLSRVINILPS